MVESIRSDIVNGVLAEGDFLPSEKAYARQFRISNKTVRQGLDMLVGEQLIEKIPRVGNKVLAGAQRETSVIRFACHTTLFREVELHALIDEFHKLHPSIRVELVPSGSTLNVAGRLQAWMSEARIDVMTLNYNGYDDFRRSDALDSLETLEPVPGIYPFLTEAVTHRGELKVQPMVFSPVVLCYNKSHFRDKGVLEPDSGWRWDELFEQASRLTVESERLGFYFHFPSTNRWPVFLLQSGLSFERDEDGGFAVSGRQLTDSLQACRELIYLQNRFPLFLSERDGDAEELFFSGKVSMMMTTYFGLNRHDHQKAFEYDVAPLPYLQEARTLLLLIGLAVNSRSEAKGDARRLVDFLVSYHAQLMIRQKTVSIPSLKEAAEWTGQEQMYRPSRFHMYRDIIPTFRTIGALNMSIHELEAFYREAKLYWSGLETEEVAASRLEELLSCQEQARNGAAN